MNNVDRVIKSFGMTNQMILSDLVTIGKKIWD